MANEGQFPIGMLYRSRHLGGRRSVASLSLQRSSVVRNLPRVDNYNIKSAHKLNSSSHILSYQPTPCYVSRATSRQGPFQRNTMLVECKCKLPAILPHALRAPVPSKYTPAQSGFFRLSEALGTFPSPGSVEEKKEVEGPKQKSNGENQTVPKSGGASALHCSRKRERERERRKKAIAPILERKHDRPPKRQRRRHCGHSFFSQLGRKWTPSASALPA